MNVAWSGNEQEFAHRLLGFEITVRRSGIVEGIGAVDEDIQSSVSDPLQDLQGALAPAIHRLGGSRAAVADEMHADGLLPQIDGRNVPSGVAVGDKDAVEAEHGDAHVEQGLAGSV